MLWIVKVSPLYVLVFASFYGPTGLIKIMSRHEIPTVLITNSKECFLLSPL